MPHDSTPPTPPTSNSHHPDLDAIADLDAGVLDGATAAVVDAHVRGCPQCTATLGALASVRVELRSLSPPALPPGVAARLDETLARLHRDEPVRPAVDQPRGPLDAAAVPTGTEPGRPDPPAPPPPPRPIVVPPVPAGHRVDPVDDLSARRDRRLRARRSWTNVSAGVVLLAAAVGVGTALAHRSESTTSTGGAVAAGVGNSGNGHPVAPSAKADQGGPDVNGPVEDTTPPAASGALPEYENETGLLNAIPVIVSQSPVDVIAGALNNNRAGVMADPDRRAACIGAIGETAADARAVERIMYKGAQAYVFVFRQTGATLSRVIVVGPTCGAGAPDVRYRGTS